MIEVKIKENLQALQDAISRADSAKITSALQELDQLKTNHARELDSRLLHFLQRRSYRKALVFLGGDKDIPAGICGGKKE